MKYYKIIIFTRYNKLFIITFTNVFNEIYQTLTNFKNWINEFNIKYFF